MNSVRSNSLSLKYHRFTPSGCKDIGITNFKFVARTQFLCFEEIKTISKNRVNNFTVLFNTLWVKRVWKKGITDCYPIRVQSCVCCLFWTNRNCIEYHLSFYLAHYPIRDKSLCRRYNSKWKYLLLLKREQTFTAQVPFICLFLLSFVNAGLPVKYDT